MLGILYGSVGPSFSFLVSFLSRPKYLWGEGHGNPLQYSCLENSRKKPGGLQSIGSQRVRHNWATFTSLHFHYLWWGFPWSSVGTEFFCIAGDLGLIPGLGRSPREENGNLLQYSCLENPMDRGTWQAIIYGVARVGHDWATKHTHSYLWSCFINFILS